METFKLRRGEMAPPNASRITVTEKPPGSFEFRGVRTLYRAAPALPMVFTSVNSPAFASFDLAVAAGLAWAGGHKVDRIFIEFADR